MDNKEKSMNKYFLEDETVAGIGVYVCHCGVNIAGVVNVHELVEYAKTIPDVTVAKDYRYLCSDVGQQIVREDIRKEELERVVIAACSPTMHEETFRRTVEEAGLNPYLLEIVNIREQCSWCHSGEPEKATEKAKHLVKMGVARAKLLKPLEKEAVRAEKSVLIIGGGIAGIQAALDLADLDFRVYLVEKSPSIGGRMAQLDKTFPTLDCSACILTPKMVDVSRHPNVQLLTNAEVEEVNGFAGNYEVVVRKKPTYVDEEKCVGCGLCTEVCPVEIPDPFNEGLCKTRAIHIYSPQAVPKVATIDSDHCLRIKYDKGVCGKCLKACEAGAINFDQKPEDIRVKVGGIIVAAGCDVFDASKIAEFVYAKSDDVVTNIEFERILNASGPTGGEIVCPSTRKHPKSVAFIQCVGCRDQRFFEHCCRVGCMVTLKHAILVREKLGEAADIYVCFNDIRAYGKGYEEFYRRARDVGVRFIAGLPSEIRMQPNKSLYFDVYDSSTNKLLEVHPDMVVLATGLVPGADLKKLQKILHISRGSDGFLLEAHPKLKPLETTTAGIFLAGVCQGPKDIPDTVSQASGAAMKAADLLIKGEIEVEPLKAVVDKEVCSGCRVCETTCTYDAIQTKTELVGDEEKTFVEVVEAACQGCGSCAAACPVNAIEMRHFTDEQILAQVDAALS